MLSIAHFVGLGFEWKVATRQFSACAEEYVFVFSFSRLTRDNQFLNHLQGATCTWVQYSSADLVWNPDPPADPSFTIEGYPTGDAIRISLIVFMVICLHSDVSQNTLSTLHRNELFQYRSCGSHVSTALGVLYTCSFHMLMHIRGIQS